LCSCSTCWFCTANVVSRRFGEAVGRLSALHCNVWIHCSQWRWVVTQSWRFDLGQCFLLCLHLLHNASKILVFSYAVLLLCIIFYNYGVWSHFYLRTCREFRTHYTCLEQFLSTTAESISYSMLAVAALLPWCGNLFVCHLYIHTLLRGDWKCKYGKMQVRICRGGKCKFKSAGMENVCTEKGREVYLQHWETIQKQIIQRWCRNNLLATFAVQWYLKCFNTSWNILAMSSDSNKLLTWRFPDYIQRGWLMKASVRPTQIFLSTWAMIDYIVTLQLVTLLTSNYWSMNKYDNDVSGCIQRTKIMVWRVFTTLLDNWFYTI